MSFVIDVKRSIHENRFTGEVILFHCAICSVEILSKTEWISHVNGQAHSSKTLNCYNVNLGIQQLINETKNILGEQNKFIILNDPKKNVYKFSCVLCDIQLNGYFAIMDHVQQKKHQNRIHIYNCMMQSKCSDGAEENTDLDFSYADRKDDNTSNNLLHKLALTAIEDCKNYSSNLTQEMGSNEVLRCENHDELLSSDLNQTINAISHLTRLYTGVLNCVFCKKTIPFKLNSILDHDFHCKLSVRNKINCNLKNGEHSIPMMHRFQQFHQTSLLNSKDSNDKYLFHDEKSYSSLVGALRSKVDQFEKALYSSVKFYECLSCINVGAIDEWESHVSLHSFPQADDPLITCFCFICEKLLFGVVAHVIQHEHFKINGNYENAVYNTSEFIVPSHMISLMQGSNKMPKYYKFTVKLPQIQRTSDCKYSFYCNICDFYGFQKIEKHFDSREHKLKANISHDLYYCRVCLLVLYGDTALIEHHRLSPEHIFLKHGKRHRTVPVRNGVHEQLLTKLKMKIDRMCELNNYQFYNNFQYYAFFCAHCDFVIYQYDEWLIHLFSVEHNQKSIVTSKMKSFAYSCIFCKLEISGTIEHVIQHTSSAGHEFIKTAIRKWVNRQRLVELLMTQCPNNSDNLLRDLLYNTGTDSENVKNFAKPLVPSDATNSKNSATKSKVEIALPEFVELAKCDDGSSSMYLKKVNNREAANIVPILQEFLQNCLEKCGQIKCKCFNCWFCGYFSSERSWWNHMKHSSHVKQVASCLQENKLTEFTVLFCRDCSVMSYGSSLIETLHVKSVNHRRKSKQLQPLEKISRGDKENLACLVDRSRKRSSSFANSPSSSRERNVDVKNVFENKYIGKDRSSSREKTGDDINEKSSFRSLSFSSNTSSTLDNPGEKISDADDYLDCDAFKESNRTETEVDDDDEEDEDQNDNIYDMLIQDESDSDPDKLSDEELNDSLMNELKKNVTQDVQSDNSEHRNSAVLEDKNDQDVQEQQKEIIKHLIIIRGIPAQAIKNKRIMFSTFSKYGEIRRPFVKRTEPDSLYLLVDKDPEEMFKKLKKNIENLKVKLGTDELTIENGTRSTDYPGLRNQLSAEAMLLFSNSKELNEGIDYLIQIYHKEATNPFSRMKIREIEAVIYNLAYSIYGKTVMIKVYAFGSRVTGLATEKSDVDLYLQIGNSFRGSIHNYTRLQQELVMLFTNNMRLFPQEFKNITSIPFARVPIVKFTHIKSDINCDLSFKSGLSTMNSILVRSYLELDDRVKYLICAVKLWMKLNDFADRNLFTTYAQIWMVLFFLMQADIAVVPTVLALRHMLPEDQKEFTIEGWNCSFPNVRNIIWRSSSILKKEELLFRFFEFYGNTSLNNYVLCTLTGLKIEKKHFLEYYQNLPLIFQHYKFKMKNDRSLYRTVRSDFEGLCIQDPFDHSHNLTKTINDKKFRSFIDICKDTVHTLRQTFVMNN